MRTPEERVIYNNYNLWKEHHEAAEENLNLNGNDIPTENQIWDEIYELDSDRWENVKEELTKYFSKGAWIIQGTVERWSGRKAGGKIFYDFNTLFNTVTKDCDYVKIWDENGHLYLKCSHHDGTNMFEIKRVTNSGLRYLKNWENNWNDKRSEKEVHTQIMNHYSLLPNFMAEVYGCPKFQWAKVS